MPTLIGVLIGLLAWFVLRILLMGVYTVSEALFDVLETQRILAGSARLTLLPSGPHSRILANLLAAEGASKGASKGPAS